MSVCACSSMLPRETGVCKGIGSLVCWGPGMTTFLSVFMRQCVISNGKMVILFMSQGFFFLLFFSSLLLLNVANSVGF